MSHPKKVIVIGSGFSGLSAAANLAQKGYDVTILEKNESPGGRASKFQAEGFTFDMGPSWYWMPDVFEAYFELFGKKPSDYYELERLDPSYRIYFDEDNIVDMPASVEELYQLFERIEPGSKKNLQKFLKEAAYKYEAGINDLVFKPGRSVIEFIDSKVISGLFRLQLFTSIRTHVHKLFKNDKLRKILEFPVYFLGALPSNTPAMYSLMNYADLVLGTWYPKGGMYKIIEGMVDVAEELGVEIKYNENVISIDVDHGVAGTVTTATATHRADIIVASADYNHVEQKLLKKEHRQYDEAYWNSRTMAPSSLIFYLGVKKKIKNLLHHNLFFDQSFEQFAEEIYVDPKWPTNPLFYVCAPSVTDESVAPKDHENLFVLVPVAPGLEDGEEIREKYYNLILDRLERLSGESIKDHVVYKRSFAHQDFKERYNAFKGNAYGLANTLKQTAIFKPNLKSPKVKNLYYAGQLTTPGPGVPPSIISGRVVAEEIEKEWKV